MDILTYALAKSYTDKALLGVGTIKGAPCTVKSQTEDDEYVYVTLGWENNLGTPEETVVKIKKGADGAPGEQGPAGDPGPQGVSITKIEKIKTEDLIDTYQISFSDNTTFEYTISNGSADYLKITNKPSIEGVELTGNKTFEDLNIASADALSATDENLQNLSDLIGDKTSLPAPTDTIVNNIASVDAKVDAIIDDNEAGLAKTFSSDKITKTFATLEEANKRIPQYDVLPAPTEAFGGKVVQFIGTTTEDYIHNYFYECVQVEGSYKWVNVAVQNVPTKVSELTNDSNFVTETELNEKGYLTEHQDLSAYATKEEIPTVPSKVSELSNDSNYQTAEQVNSTVTTEIAKIVADAPEDLNTLKEMSDWIAGHENDASAMNSAISDNKTAITALQTGKADKSEIPTTLPANGGNSDTVNNHTVETDVPIDAVFTDTIYDDTEVKGSIAELNSNLDEQGYGENSGGDNVWNEKYVIGRIDSSGKITAYATAIRSDYFSIKPNTKYTIIKNTPNFFYAFYDENKTVIGERLQLSGENRQVTTPTNAKYMIIMVNGTTNYNNDISVIEGDATEYKPYIMSNKQLTDEVNQQNENLDTLEYSNIAGGKNLFNPKCLLNATYDEKTNTITVSNNTNKALDMVFKENTQYTFSAYIKQSNSSTNNRLMVEYNDGTTDTAFLYTQSTSEVYLSQTSESGKTISEVNWYYGSKGTATFRNFQIEEGTTSTPYEPYIPSVKMLAEENVQQSIEAMDLKMLGWTVPSECPVQNYVDSDGVFHQIVGRVDLGSLDWIYETELNRFAALLLGKFKPSNQNEWTRGLYCVLYEANPSPIVDDKVNMTISGYSDDEHLYLHNFSYTDATTFKNAMQGVYLYYELETPITMNIDGNEVTERINESLSDYGLDNKCPELGQGYCNFSGTDNEFQWISQPSTFVGTKNPIDCMSGDIIRVLFDFVPNNIVIQWNDGTHARVDNANELSAVVPNGVTKCCAYCATQDLTPTTIGNVRIYVNNAIDELKNDLDTLELSDVAGGKNLFDGKIIVGKDNYAYFELPKSNVHISISDRDINVDISNIYFGLSNTVVPNYDTMIWAFVNNGTIVGRDSNDFINSSFIAKSLSIYPNDANTVTKILQRFNIQIEEGTTATPYEPYIPSVKMLAEEVNQQNKSLEVIGKCKNLLNPILQTTTLNGVTCTANGDGTYTLKGKSTSSSNTNFVIPFSSPFEGKCKLIGCPSDIDSIAELQCNYNGVWDSKNTDHGKGSILDSTNLLTNIAIVIFPNVTVNNLVFKPMITTDLNATYDDFVPYTGDGDTLTHDVAELNNDLDKLNLLPKGFIIQIDADKDDIETTKQKYGWQYLGTSNIEYESGSANILVTNVYRKNN